MKLLVVVLVAISVLVMLPPLLHGYIYPNNSDDSAEHVIYFKNMNHEAPLYYGQYLAGWLFNRLPFDMNVAFLWFNYISFTLIMWAVGISVALAVNCKAGIMASLLTFGFSETMNLFDCGVIFDLIGIGLLLPITLLCLHNMGKNMWWKGLAVLSLVAFMFFHGNGRYILALLPIVVIYEMLRDKIRFVGKFAELWNNRYLMYLLGVIFGIYIMYLIDLRTSFFSNSLSAEYSFSSRLLIDAWILFIIAVAIVISMVYIPKKAALSFIPIFLALLLTLPNILIWLQDNSAIKRADKEAIAYVNSLNGETYTASPQVAEEVYGLFLNKQFSETYYNADYAVVRSTPMTLRSDPDATFFDNQDRLALSSYMAKYSFRLLKEFDYGERGKNKQFFVTVWVYERMK